MLVMRFDIYVCVCVRLLFYGCCLLLCYCVIMYVCINLYLKCRWKWMQRRKLLKQR
jgi:hypothetical protein